MHASARTTLAAVLDIWNGAPADRLAPLLTGTYRGHMLGAPNGERDGAAYPASIERFRAANPGVVFTVVEQFDTDDRLVTRLEAHRSGVTPGTISRSHGINISRFDSTGRLAEEWAIWSAWQDQE